MGNFDVQKLIAKVEARVHGENSPECNGSIDTMEEKSIFLNELNQAVKDGEINEADCFNIYREYAGVKQLNEVQITGKKPTFWDKVKKVAVPVVGGLAMVAGGILCATGVGSGLGIALLAVGGAGLLTSCQKEPIEHNITNNNYNTNNIDINIETERLLEEIRQLREQMHSDSQATSALLGRMEALLINILAETQSGNQLTQEALAKLNEIINLLKTISNNIVQYGDDTKQLLQSILDKIEQYGAATIGGLNVIIEKMGENQDMLRLLLAALERNNDLTQQILTKLGQMDANQQQFFINALAKMDEIIANQHLSQDKQDQLYNLGIAILNKIPENAGTSGQDYTAILNAILEKLDDIDNNMSTKLNTIIGKLGQLDSDMLEGIQNIINNNNQNTADIIAAMNQNKAELALILQGLRVDIQGLSQTVLDDLTQIIANQGTQINNQETMGQALNDIKAILQAIRAQIGSDGNSTIMSRLAEILAKIPDGCHCETLDLSEIIIKLNIIIEHLGNGNDNNEGVLNDLEEELGM